MELARFANRGEAKQVRERLYVGHPGCAAWLDAPQWIAELTRPFTLVVAPLSEPNLGRFARFLRQLAAGGNPEIELSLNDWGTLDYCRGYIREQSLPWRLAAGVMLAEQHTDPLLPLFSRPTPEETPVWSGGQPARLVWEPPPAPLAEHWRWPIIFGNIPLLRELGVSRLELCAQPLPWPEQGPELPVSVYQRAILSVFPCGAAAGTTNPALKAEAAHAAACAACPAVQTAGQRGKYTLYREHNLIWYQPENAPPAWADRVVAW